MAILNLDFTNVKEFSNLPVGKQVVKITKVEEVKASTGSAMLKITFENGSEDTGFENFVLTESALWKLRELLKAIFKTEFKGVINLNTDTMIGRTCEVTVKEEEYMKQDGTPGIRTVIDNYMPISDAPAMGIAPQAPVAPQPTAPQAPVGPQTTPVYTMPNTPQVAPQTPVTPTQPVYTTPAQPQAPVYPGTPATPEVPQAPVYPGVAQAPQTPVTPQAPVAPQPTAPQAPVAPQPTAPQAPAGDSMRPKRPWEV